MTCKYLGRLGLSSEVKSMYLLFESFTLHDENLIGISFNCGVFFNESISTALILFTNKKAKTDIKNFIFSILKLEIK